jgi:hypothetical protein
LVTNLTAQAFRPLKALLALRFAAHLSAILATARPIQNPAHHAAVAGKQGIS